MSELDPALRVPEEFQLDRFPERVVDGTALCLSGGGYRAMLFHLGALWRLNDAGRLLTLDRISSVSGGSITAGALAKQWAVLDFDGVTGVARNFVDEVVEPVRGMARKGIDVGSVLTGVLSPWRSPSDEVAAAYRRHLFGDTRLDELPVTPRFVFNATNLESGALFRFSRPYLADWKVGRVLNPTLPLAVAVAASSAFPPFLSPVLLDLSDADWTTDPRNELTGDGYRGEITLTDGGVYDNLGLESAKRFRTVLVCDGGGRLAPDSSVPTDWPRHVLRVLLTIDNQVRSLRRRNLVDAFEAGRREGMYVGIGSAVADFGLADPMPADPRITADLAATPTRLDDVPEDRQELLVNWGYTICDTGLRRYVDSSLPRGSLPYPARPLA